MINKQERGAIMLEVLAVLALIGVMGPMLYKQVLSRNQEISNVNIAAEMRFNIFALCRSSIFSPFISSGHSYPVNLPVYYNTSNTE